MIRVAPGGLRGCLRAPASKSHAQRLLLAAALAPGESLIRGLGRSGDVRACLGVLRALGAEVEEADEAGDQVRVRGGLPVGTGPLDCGESGFCLRACAALAALGGGPWTLLGRGTLAGRSTEMVLAPLRALGARAEAPDGRPPLTVQGPLEGGRAVVDGAASSQALSGLLLALPAARKDSVLEVRGLRSAPYVRMTLEVASAFGLRVEASSALDAFRIPGGQVPRAGVHDVEGDWSGAAFLLVAGALAGELRLEGLRPDSPQADRAILEALRAAGAAPVWEAGALRVAEAPLHAFSFDATDCPDLFPPLAALACHARGTSRIAGAGRLRGKESDRAATLLSELGALGARLARKGDVLEVTGGPLAGGSVRSHGDHRIAMACAVAALRARAEVEIADAGCVAKSYPAFFDDLAQLKGER